MTCDAAGLESAVAMEKLHVLGEMPGFDVTRGNDAPIQQTLDHGREIRCIRRQGGRRQAGFHLQVGQKLTNRLVEVIRRGHVA